MTVLTADDLDRFVERGFCTLRGAFTAAQAATATAVVWRRIEEKSAIRAADPATWPPAYDIEETVAAPEVLACFSDRLAAGIEQLLGPGRWCGRRGWGFWPVSFAYGADEPGPWPTWSWHVDGNWFLHTVDCPRQGLLVIGLFTDVAPGGGGTVVAGGSHRRAARVLAAHPGGLRHTDLFDLVLAEPIGDFCELTGAAGDVVLAHPFLFHSRGLKRHGGPRVISNVEAPLLAPMQLARADGDYSVLERSIRDALAAGPEPLPADALRCRF